MLSHIKSIFDCHTHARYYLSITHLVFCSTSLVRNVAKNQSNYRRRKIRESFSSKSCWHIQFDKEGSFSKTKQDVNAILKISKHWRNMMPLSHSFIIRTEQLIWKFFVNGIMPIIIENELKRANLETYKSQIHELSMTRTIFSSMVPMIVKTKQISKAQKNLSIWSASIIRKGCVTHQNKSFAKLKTTQLYS